MLMDIWGKVLSPWRGVGDIFVYGIALSHRAASLRLCIPRKVIARSQYQFPHSWVCERFIYSQDRSTYFPAAELADRSCEYVNSSLTHECGNWDWGSAIPFLGIFVPYFRYCAFQCTYVAWQAGTATLCHSRWYPPVRDQEFDLCSNTGEPPLPHDFTFPLSLAAK